MMASFKFNNKNEYLISRNVDGTLFRILSKALFCFPLRKALRMNKYELKTNAGSDFSVPALVLLKSMLIMLSTDIFKLLIYTILGFIKYIYIQVN